MKPETVEQVAVAQVVEPIQEKAPSDSDSSKFFDGLSQAELAKRLKNPKTRKSMNTSNVGRAQKKGEEEFLSWSRERDPDSIGWRYCEKTKRYLKAE